MKVWSFCDGWQPERLPLAAAFYGIDDLESLTSTLLSLRSYMASREDQQS